MPDINELELAPELTPEGDWDAPESGRFPPELAPGEYTFLFRVPSDGKTALIEVKETREEKVKYAQVNFDAEALANGSGQAVPAREDTKQPTLRFQRASFYKTPKMKISQGQDLLRSLGLRVSPLTGAAIAQALREADGRRTFRAEVGWRAYFTTTETTVSTHARTKRGEIRWPKKLDGTFEEVVADPQSGEKAYGRAEIVRFRLPEGESRA